MMDFTLLLLFVSLFIDHSYEKSCCELTSSPLTLRVDLYSGKVVSCRLDDQELLAGREADSTYFGATLWPDPQSRWWPVPVSLDGRAYALVQKSKKSLTIRSRPLAGDVLQFEKTFVMMADSGILVRYTIKNISSIDQQVGPWELIRTYGGLTFFPNEDKIAFPESNLKNVSSDGKIVWYRFNKEDVDDHQKLFSSASSGWIAHSVNNLLFIKTFPDLSQGQIATGQGEVELYVNDKATYVELETHGAHVKLHPGESLVYEVKWYLRNWNKIANPEALLDYTEAFVRRKKTVEIR